MNTADVDIDFLRRCANARQDVGAWIAKRPNVGLSVSDVILMVDGFDYMVSIIKDLTGKDVVQNTTQIQETKPNIEITEL